MNKQANNSRCQPCTRFLISKKMLFINIFDILIYSSTLHKNLVREKIISSKNFTNNGFRFIFCLLLLFVYFIVVVLSLFFFIFEFIEHFFNVFVFCYIIYLHVFHWFSFIWKKIFFLPNKEINWKRRQKIVVLKCDNNNGIMK